MNCDAKENGKRLKNIVGQTKVFLLDMDGTIYIENELIGDMRNTLEAVRRSGRRIVYFTNNSSKTVREYEEKLTRLGIFGQGDEVYTSGVAAAEYLNEFYAGKKVYLVGTDGLKGEFAEAGIPLADADGAEIGVLAYDTTLTFEKIVKLNRMIAEGKPYIATHPDAVCPAKGVFPPDVGSFIELFKCSSGRYPDVICGKPYTVMGDCIKRRLCLPPENICMVGDRPHTDIRFANNNGFRSILVLSGETDAAHAAAAPDKAEAVAESLNEIAALL